MTISDIINAILAGLTFVGIIVALFLGIRSINESRKLQRAQFIERMIEKILKWTFDIDKCGTDFNLQSITEVKESLKNGKSASTYHSIIAGKLENEYYKLSKTGRALAIMCVGKIKPLSEPVEELIDILIQWGDYHDKYRQRFIDMPDDIIKVKDLLIEWVDNETPISKKYVEVRDKIVNQTDSLARTIWH